MLPVLAFALAGLFADASGAEPIDRVVAVVDEKPIFLSELRTRARPHLYRIDSLGGDAKVRAASRAEMYRELLNRMIDERLEQREAEKAHLSVSADEIDSGIKQVGKQMNMAPADLFAEAKKQGLSEADYRAEIGRQVLEGKLIQLRVRSRVKVTEADARTMYATFTKEQNASIDLRIIVLKATDAAEKKASEALAAQIVAQAKTGTDFCTLVTKHSTDPATKTTCGSRGPLSLSSLAPDISRASSPLKPGEVAPPVVFNDPASGQAVLVIQRAPGAGGATPTFESVKDKMMDRAYVEATERARKQWIEDLRKPAFIEVKL